MNAPLCYSPLPNKRVYTFINLETYQPGIIETILDLVQATTATDDRRRSEILQTTRYSPLPNKRVYTFINFKTFFQSRCFY